jgi:hypothetical protein
MTATSAITGNSIVITTAVIWQFQCRPLKLP